MRLQAAAFLLVVFVTAGIFPPAQGLNNITKILQGYSSFSTFNHYLTLTHLAEEINHRVTITVLALDNSAMSSLISHGFSIPTLTHILSFQVLVDYFNPQKLHELNGGAAQSSTLFQASGDAPGSSGFVNITDGGGGSVTFTPSTDNSSSATFVKSVKEIPYNLSIIQISSALLSPQADAPAPSPAAVNLTEILSAKGCALFANLIATTGNALEIYQNNVESGITVFCPVDKAVEEFQPFFQNLTSDEKLSLVLYQAIPVYNSLQMLETGNGVVNTLASDGSGKGFSFTVQDEGESVTLETKVVTATITGTILVQDPDAVYTIDKVLEPPGLFNASSPSPAPAPAPGAESPAPASRNQKAPPETEGPSPDASPSDEKSNDQNDGGRKAHVATWISVEVLAVAVFIAAILA